MKITNKNTKITNSYLVKRKEIKSTIDEVINKRKAANYPITRSRTSYIRELRAHNLMFKLGLFKKHTKDTDLEEPIKLWKEIIYFLIGW